MVDNKRLAEDLAAKIKYQPTDDKILVKPLKPVMVTKLVPVAPKNEGKTVEEIEQSKPIEPERRKVEANVRRGIIIKLGTEYQQGKNPEGYEVGDVVIYPTYGGTAFELLKDSRLLRRYEVMAIEHNTV